MRNTETKPSIPAIDLSLTDYFLNPDFFNHPDTLRRARILIIILYFSIGIISAAILFLIATPVTPISRYIGIPIDAAVITVFMGLLFKLKNKGLYRECSNAVVVILLLSTTIGTAISGGITYSPFAQLLVIPPLVAFFFGSVRGGISITAATAAATILMITLENNGVSFPKTIRPEHMPITQSLTLLVEFVFVTTLALVYEYTSASLRIERDIDHQNVIRLAQTDQLTGLANRRAFDDTVSKRITYYSTMQPVRTFALCYLDLDGFKPINDRHGHDVGDQVLRAISIRLRSALRGTDLIGRHGGDEFMLLLDELGSAPAVEAMARRFLKLICEPIETSSGLVSIGGSFGFAIFPMHGSDPDVLKKAADMAMYETKRNHLGWKIFDAENVCPLY
jgi:diguanylate cyclase (GGDEF)-like protein